MAKRKATNKKVEEVKMVEEVATVEEKTDTIKQVNMPEEKLASYKTIAIETVMDAGLNLKMARYLATTELIRIVPYLWYLKTKQLQRE